MKRFLILILALFVVTALCGCQSPEPEVEISPEQDLMERSFPVRNTTQHNTLDELIENCAAQGIQETMESFPAGEFEQLSFFTTYYIWDNDFNFPTSVIAFEYDGVTFYYAGAEKHNPFIEYPSGPFFDGDGMVAVIMEKDGEAITSGMLDYYRYPDEFALSPEHPVDAALYYDTLAKITGAEFRCLKNEVVGIYDNAVEINFISYHMDEAKYNLSDPSILNELSLSFSPPDEEFVNYSSDPNAPGGDMVQSPAHFYVKFEITGAGSTVINIFGEDEAILYSAEIAVDEELNAYLPNETF